MRKAKDWVNELRDSQNNSGRRRMARRGTGRRRSDLARKRLATELLEARMMLAGDSDAAQILRIDGPGAAIESERIQVDAAGTLTIKSAIAAEALVFSSPQDGWTRIAGFYSGDGGEFDTVDVAHFGSVIVDSSGTQSLAEDDDTFALTPGWGAGLESLHIIAGKGNDTLRLTDETAATNPVIRFEAGEGDDVLLGPRSDTQWFVSGLNSGTVDSAEFNSVETLQGSADNEDVFTVGPQGRLDGGVDGGEAGFDTLEFVGGVYENVTFVGDNGSDGRVILDGQTVEYLGLEPVTLGVVMENLTINADAQLLPGSFFSDDLVLENHSTAGQSTLRNQNPDFKTIEDVVFANPAKSLTITLGLGNDRLTINTLDPGFAADLTVTGDIGRDQVVFASDVTLRGNDLRVDAEEISIGFAIGNFSTQSTWTPGASYSDLVVESPASVDGSGMTVDVQVDARGNPIVALNSPGTGYQIGDEIAITEPERGTAATGWVLGDGSVGVSVATRLLDFNNKATTDGGSITLTGESLAVGPGSSLLADAPGAGFRAGDITLEAEHAPNIVDSLALDTLSPFAIRSRNAYLSIADATLRGDDITVNAKGATNTRWDDLGDYAESITSGLFDVFAQFPQLALSTISPINGQVKIHHASAAVDLASATIVGQGNVSIQADSEADAGFTAIGINRLAGPVPAIVTIGYGEAQTSARITTSGTTHITAENDVTIKANTKSDSEVSSSITANGVTSAGDKTVDYAATVAIVYTTETATIQVGESSVIESRHGSIDIASNGEVSNASSASSAVFQNGDGALAVAVSVNEAEITADVFGTLKALDPQARGQFTFDASEATVVDLANNTIQLTNVPAKDKLRVGQQIIYQSLDETPLAGLTNGQAYYVFDVTDSDMDDDEETVTQTVKLASAPGIDLERPTLEIDSAEHTVSRMEIVSFDASQVDAEVGDLRIAGLPLVDGETVTYRGSYSSLDETIASAKFAAAGTHDTITVSGSPTWTELRFRVGNVITLSDTNESTDAGDYRIESISPDGLTITVSGENRLTPTPSDQNEEQFTVTTEQGLIVPGLVQGTEYEVAVSDGVTRFRNPTDASAFIQMPVDAILPTGTHGFTRFDEVATFRPTQDVDGDLDLIKLPSHNFQTGDLIRYRTDPTISVQTSAEEFTSEGRRAFSQVTLPDPPVDGLESGHFYYVVVIDDNHIKLAPNALLAQKSLTADLTSLGEGTHAISVEELASGIAIRANLDANNGAAAGVALSDAEQTTADLLSSPTNPESIIAGVQSLTDIFRKAAREGAVAAQDAAEETKTDTESTRPLDLAGTVAVDVGVHNVRARIGKSAVVQSAKDVHVDASITENFAVVANSEATRNGRDADDTSENEGGSGADFEISVAIGVGAYINHANAIIDEEATVNASDTLTTQSLVEYPLRIENPVDVINPAETSKESGLDAFEFLTEGTLGFSDLFNMSVSALGGEPSSESDALTVGTGIGVLFFDNDSVARIGADANINQNVLLQSENQRVQVLADTEMRIVEMGSTAAINLSAISLLESGPDQLSGIASGNVASSIGGFFRDIINPFGLSGKDAVGPVIVANVSLNNTVAEVQSGAVIHTGQKTLSFAPRDAGVVTVDDEIIFAEPHDLESGDELVYEVDGNGAPIGGLQDGVTYYAIVDATKPNRVMLAASAEDAMSAKPIELASFAAAEVVHRLRIKSGLAVKANQDILNIAIAQTGGRASRLGVAASIAVGVLTSTVRANVYENVTVTGGVVQVNANDDVNRIGIAGAFLRGKQTGIGISVGVNVMVRDVAAFIGRGNPANAPTAPTSLTIDVMGPVEVDATAGGSVFALVVAGAVQGSEDEDANDDSDSDSDSDTDSDSGSDIADELPEAEQTTNTENRTTGAVALTIPVAVNVLDNDVIAYLDQQNVVASNVDVAATAELNNLTVVVGASFAVQKQDSDEGSQKTLNVAGFGSFAVNVGSQTLESTIRDSSVTTRGPLGVRVTSDERSKFGADGGGVALALSKSTKGTNVAFGAAIGVNDLKAASKALIRNATILAELGDVSVLANTSPFIQSVTIGGAAAAGIGGNDTNVSVAMAGAASFNVIGADDVDASFAAIVDSDVTTENGDVVVHAVDGAQILAVSGAISLAVAIGQGKSTGAGSLGIGLSFNSIANNTTATIERSNVDAFGSVIVTAETSVPGPAAVDFTGGRVAGGADTIDLDDHGFSTGDRVVYRNLGSVDEGVGGLQDGQRYYLIRVNDDQIRLAETESAADANEPVAIDLEAPNVGTSHRLDWVNPNIEAIAFSGSVGVSSGAGTTGAFSGVGAGARNQISNRVDARILSTLTKDGDGIVARQGDVRVSANDTSSIRSTVVGATVGATNSTGGNSGNLTIGVSAAYNFIDNEVTARIETANVLSESASGDVVIAVLEDATISSVAVAASVSAAFSSGNNAAALSGGGADATNVITTKANAYGLDSEIESGGDTTVSADSSALAETYVVSTAASVSLSGNNAGGAAIGAARARNFVGYELGVFGAGDEDAAESQAYLKDTSVIAGKNLNVVSFSDQTIQAFVLAASAAVSASNNNAGGLAGSGVETNNQILVLQRAFIDGDQPLTDDTATRLGLTADQVLIDADDASTISSVAIGAAIAFAGSANNAAAASIGVSFANNSIANEVEAKIINAAVQAIDGGVEISASSRGRKLFDLDAGLAAQLDDAAFVENDDDSTGNTNEAEVDIADDVTFMRSLRKLVSENG
ncbi:MAG: hypothetical protein AAFV88_18790, partial [Planctomycetota bacterium]